MLEDSGEIEEMPEFKQLRELCLKTQGNPNTADYKEIMRLSGEIVDAVAKK